MNRKLRLLVPHLAAIAVIAGCAALTVWQLDRAAEKQRIIDAWSEREAKPLERLQAPFDPPRPVTGVGSWDRRHQILVDNRVRRGQPGVHVLTPFRIPDGRLFLVDRGWAPWPDRNGPRPDPGGIDNRERIRGVLTEPPDVGIRVGEALSSDDRWPLLITWFDHDELAARLGGRLQPAVIRLEPAHPAHLTGDRWKIVSFGPRRHIGYALTWASIALAVAVIWTILGVRQIRHRRR